MRHFTKKLLIVLIILTSYTGLASNNFEVQVKSGQVLNIKISNTQEASQLIFKDDKGEILFNETSLTSNYVRYISLENLPLGAYFISLENSSLTSTKTVTKTKSGIEVSTSEVAFKPHFKQMESDAKKIKVAFVNTTKSPAEFKVFDKDGYLVITLNSSDAIFNKTLDFSEVPSGEYSIAVNTKERSYYKNISIK